MNTSHPVCSDEKRIRIAKACGWTEIKHCGRGIHRGVQPSGGRRNLPDYFRDLNAMHESESKLSDDQHRQFRRELNQLVFEQGKTSSHCTRRLVSATATQRAEAFGRTLELW